MNEYTKTIINGLTTALTSKINTYCEKLGNTLTGKINKAQSTANSAKKTATEAKTIAQSAQKSADKAAEEVARKVDSYDAEISGFLSFNRLEGSSRGFYSTALGNACTASGTNSLAEGLQAKAIGEASHAEGYNTVASNAYSHAEGYQTEASGKHSHAEGYETTASGYISHAEGFNTTASGEHSHAEGSNTIASAYSAHAEGSCTIASGQKSHVQGQYNIEDANSKYAHIVGNGTGDNARSNAHTLNWRGVPWFQGRPQFGGTAQDDGSQTVMANGDKELILTSSTYGSTKKFRITVNDSGTLSATEVT